MMKKYLIVILTILAFAFSQKTIHAQSDSIFAPDHAEWWHDDYYGGQVTDRVHAEVVGDTLIQNIMAIKIEQTRYRRTWHQDNTNTIDTFIARSLFVYNTEDTVFIFNENFNRFTPLYIFNVQVGDTVCLPVIPDIYNQSDLLSNPIANGDTSFCFIIDSISTVLYDTNYLETFFEHTININPPAYNWPAQEGNLKGAYARKIGGISGLLPVKMQGGIPKPTQDTLSFNSLMGGFQCYEEDSLKIHIQPVGGASCYFEYVTNIKEHNLFSNLIHISPNPTNNTINIQNENGFSAQSHFSITDLNGKVLLTKTLLKREQKVSIPLKSFATGIYFLQIRAKEGVFFQKIILTK